MAIEDLKELKMKKIVIAFVVSALVSNGCVVHDGSHLKNVRESRRK